MVVSADLAASRRPECVAAGQVWQSEPENSLYPHPLLRCPRCDVRSLLRWAFVLSRRRGVYGRHSVRIHHQLRDECLVRIPLFRPAGREGAFVRWRMDEDAWNGMPLARKYPALAPGPASSPLLPLLSLRSMFSFRRVLHFPLEASAAIGSRRRLIPGFHGLGRA